MEFQQLKYFETIARTQNISAAAKQLFIAQPSLSQTLKRLENEVGTELFDRVGKQIVLNDAGKIFLKYTNEIFKALDNAMRELSAYKDEQLTNVCICVQATSLLLPEIISEIQASYPNIHLQLLQHTDMEETIPLDLKIYADYTCKPMRSKIVLMEEPIGIVLPSDHRLADKEHIIMEDLINESFISLSKGHNLYNINSYYCDKFGFAPNISTYVDSPNIMRDLLKINLGIAFVPQYTWSSFYKDSLVFRSIGDMHMTRCIILSWDESRYMTASVEHCKKVITDFFVRYKRKFI
ncbi:LysR family transcriptional regulator [Ruminococcus sp. Marseille-P6503]|uniref:LysR family transcriptional regulator n=1 Tax=Ruminococcus sp. Marseille-P6503 TaxID=2364796 RepID=UPI000F535E93|nr:LysR family transcriptional regulator [Ruminococcus sp. Marseille-P6503]